MAKMRDQALRRMAFACSCAALVDCGSGTATSTSESYSSRTSAKLVLEHFPSARRTETGVDEWDLGNVMTNGRTYVIARGFTSANGPRSAMIEVVAPAHSGGASFVRAASGDALSLNPLRAQAIASDLAAMSTAMQTHGGASARPQSIHVAAGACDAGSSQDTLVTPCATELLECTSELTLAAETTGEVAHALGGDNATVTAPSAATLAEGARAPDRRCVDDGLGPNDLSVLMPFHRGEPGFRRLIPLSDYVSPSLFDQVASTAVHVSALAHFAPENSDVGSGVWPTMLELPVSGPNGPIPLGASTLGNWRIVSFRFDPCAPPAPHLVPVITKPAVPNPNIPPAYSPPTYDAAADRPNVEMCSVELRVIAQPFRWYEPETQARDGDTTMHLFYRFGAPGQPDVQARDEILRQLRALKAASPAPTAGALGIHPGLAADRDGRFTAEVARVLHDLTSRTQLSQIAFMGLRDPVLRANAGRGIDGGPDMWNFFFGRVDGDRFTQLDIEPSWSVRFESRENRYAAGPDNVQTLSLTAASDYGGSRNDITQADVENTDTRVATVRNTTCATCHFKSRSDQRIINFGYVSGAPSIAQRTVMETDAVVRTVRALTTTR